MVLCSIGECEHGCRFVQERYVQTQAILRCAPYTLSVLGGAIMSLHKLQTRCTLQSITYV